MQQQQPEGFDGLGGGHDGLRTWEVYALVDATPISQPALMWMPQSVAAAMAEPTVLVTPRHSAPCFLA